MSSSAAAAATKPADPPAPRHPHAGAWHGTYRAVKGEVSVPTGVQYQSWKADDGSERSGKGEIKLTVEDDGSVSGSSQGALGQQALRGQMDGDTLRAGLFAETPDEGMSGVLTGVVKGTELTAKLQVSDGRGNLVRQSAVVLSRAASADGH